MTIQINMQTDREFINTDRTWMIFVENSENSKRPGWMLMGTTNLIYAARSGMTEFVWVTIKPPWSYNEFRCLAEQYFLNPVDGEPLPQEKRKPFVYFYPIPKALDEVIEIPGYPDV